MWHLRDKTCGGRFPELTRMWIAPLQTTPALLTYAADGTTVEDPHVSAWLEVSFDTAELVEKASFTGDWAYQQTLTLNLNKGRDGRETGLYMSRLGEACRWHVLALNGTGELWLSGVTDGFSAATHSFSMARSEESNQLTFSATDRYPSYPVTYDYARFGMETVDPLPPQYSNFGGSNSGGGSGSGVWDPFVRLGDFYGWEDNEN